MSLILNHLSILSQTKNILSETKTWVNLDKWLFLPDIPGSRDADASKNVLKYIFYRLYDLDLEPFREL